MVLEGEVQGLGGEVSEHVGEVSLPESSDSLLSDDSVSAVHDAGVSLGEGSVLEHLVLVLESELDDLDGRGEGLGDCSGDSSHHEVDHESLDVLLFLEGLLGLDLDDDGLGVGGNGG